LCDFKNYTCTRPSTEPEISLIVPLSALRSDIHLHWRRLSKGNLLTSDLMPSQPALAQNYSISRVKVGAIYPRSSEKTMRHSAMKSGIY